MYWKYVFILLQDIEFGCLGVGCNSPNEGPVYWWRTGVFYLKL